MLPSRTRLLVGLSMLLASFPAAGDGGDGDGGGSRTDARTISGTVSALLWSQSRLEVDSSDGPVTLTFDRNTAVFLDSRLGSMRDVAVGTPVRASFGGDKRAVWLEVLSRANFPAAGLDGGAGGTDGGDTPHGPPVLPPPPAESSAADAGPGDGGSARPSADAGVAVPPGGVPSGPAPPEPNPGVTPPRPPPPGPSGPGPVPGGPER